MVPRELDGSADARDEASSVPFALVEFLGAGLVKHRILKAGGISAQDSARALNPQRLARSAHSPPTQGTTFSAPHEPSLRVQSSLGLTRMRQHSFVLIAVSRDSDLSRYTCISCSAVHVGLDSTRASVAQAPFNERLELT